MPAIVLACSLSVAGKPGYPVVDHFALDCDEKYCTRLEMYKSRTTSTCRPGAGLGAVFTRWRSLMHWGTWRSRGPGPATLVRSCDQNLAPGIAGVAGTGTMRREVPLDARRPESEPRQDWQEFFRRSSPSHESTKSSAKSWPAWRGTCFATPGLDTEAGHAMRARACDRGHHAGARPGLMKVAPAPSSLSPDGRATSS